MIHTSYSAIDVIAKSPQSHTTNKHISRYFSSHLLLHFEDIQFFPAPHQNRLEKMKREKTTTKRQTRNPEVLESSVRSAQARVDFLISGAHQTLPFFGCVIKIPKLCAWQFVSNNPETKYNQKPAFEE